MVRRSRTRKVSKRCPAKWVHMHGDDHVRTCTHCDRKVYHLGGLPEGEARTLVSGRRSARSMPVLYEREDGSVMTQPCFRTERTITRVKACVVAAVTLLGLSLVPYLGAGKTTNPRAAMRRHLAQVQTLTERIRKEPDPAKRAKLIKARAEQANQAKAAAARIRDAKG